MKRLLLASLLIVLPLAARADTTEPRVLSADAQTADVDTVALEIGVGEVHVTASSDDKVHARVTLRRKQREFMWFFHWMTEGSTSAIAAARIDERSSGGRLTLSLALPHSSDQDDLKQEWDVQLPARLKLDAVMDVGDLSIEGVAGGVMAKLNVGELSLDLPQGSIDANVNVGEIRAKSASTHHGRIELSSSIGDVALFQQGSEAGTHRHGGLGSRVSLDGSGPDDIQLKLNIGEVTLHLDSQDEGKAYAKDGSGK
jgi:hypothetical protein